MAAVWLIAGIGSLFAYFMGYEVSSGSPDTLWATFGSICLGLALGTLAGRWWPSRRSVHSIIEQFPRVTATFFWLVIGAFGLWMFRGSAISAPWSIGASFGYLVGTTVGSGQARQPPKYLAGIRFIAAAVLITVPFFGDPVLRALSLDIGDAIGDYRRARVKDAVRFRKRLCWNGACLTRRDWACGFTNGDEEAFDRCFDDVVARAAPSVGLDDVRKYCGNLTMKFAGATYSTPEECQAAGGNWGVKSSPPRLRF